MTPFDVVLPNAPQDYQCIVKLVCLPGAILSLLRVMDRWGCGGWHWYRFFKKTAAVFFEKFHLMLEYRLYHFILRSSDIVEGRYS